MSTLHVERIGGLAGFGGARSHLRSRGEVDFETLSGEDKRTVESLFKSKGSAEPSQVRDGFLYRIARTTPGGVETIEVPEDVVPAAIRHCVKDELI
jgi:Emfourin